MNGESTEIVDVITVSPDAVGSSRGHLKFGGKTVMCCLGRSGVRQAKVEGDGATPLGQFQLRRVLYRADRIEAPRTALPKTTIKADDGWCDDPSDGSYNQLVRLPYGARAETLWRNDRRYDVIIVIGHNDDPVITGNGSAIFIHLMDIDEGPTAGCIALDPDNMNVLLECVGPETIVDILNGIS